jgi:pimeloyl-ACP methyl ester carboxylesterase
VRVLFKDVLGYRTRLLVEGNGAPVILLHGLGTLAERWLANIDVLGEHHSVFAPDLLTHGLSQDVRFGDAAPQLRQVEHIVALMDAFGVERSTVIGSSYGGLLASLVAINHSDRVNRLVIVGSGSALHRPDRQAEVLKAVKANTLKAFHEGTLAACRRRMQNTTFDPSAVSEPALQMLLTANALPGRLEATGAFFDSVIQHARRPECLVIDRLEEIKAPTLIVTGRDDIRASWERAEAASKRIPDCRLRIFERCGHAPMLEHADDFNREVLAFLGAPAADRARAS